MPGTGTGSRGKTARRTTMTPKNITATASRFRSANLESEYSNRPKNPRASVGFQRASKPRTTVNPRAVSADGQKCVPDWLPSGFIVGEKNLYVRKARVRAEGSYAYSPRQNSSVSRLGQCSISTSTASD